MNADQEPRNVPNASDGTPDHFGTRPDEAELTDRLTAIADRHVPVPDWADLVHRAESPPSIPLHRVGAGSGGGRRPFGRSTLAVAAALIVVIGAVGTFVATRGGDDESVDSGPAGPKDVELIDTGWYIPTPLPEGWKVTSIEASTMTLVGPATLATWAAPDGSASLTYVSEPWDDTGIPMNGPSIQLTDEIGGRLLDEQDGYPGAVGWEHDDLLHLVIGNGIEAADVEDAARQVAADPGRTISPVEGLGLITRSERTYTERESADVTIELRTPEGRQLLYQLSPGEGFGRSALLATIPVPRQVEGQPLEVLELTARPGGLTSDTSDYLGLWPGADVTLPLGYPYLLDDTQNPPTDDEVATLLRSLRPATAEQWRSFLASTGLEVDERLRTAERLVDLSPDAGDPTPDSTTPDMDDEDFVEPTTIDFGALFTPWPDEMRSRFDEGLTQYAWLAQPPDPEISSGTTVSFGSQLTNNTGEPHFVNECTVAGSIAVFVSVDAVQPVPLPDISRCDPNRTVMTVAPGATVDWPFGTANHGGLPTRQVISGPQGTYLGGTLPPGAYHLVTQVPARVNFQIQTAYPITITSNPCGGFTTEMVDRYIFRTEADARAEAAADGMALRVVRIDGVDLESSDELRCDRLNVGLIDDRIVWVDIY